MTLPPPPDAQRMRDWLDHCEREHTHPINRALHAVCMPLGAWAVPALLWAIPVPQRWLQPGAWAVLATVLAFYWYWKRSRVLAAAVLAGFAVLLLLARYAALAFGHDQLILLAATALVLALIGRFIGQRFEGHRTGFPLDPVHWLIGPAWLMARLLQRFGIHCP